MLLSDLAVHFLVSWVFKEQSHTHMAIKVVWYATPGHTENGHPRFLFLDILPADGVASAACLITYSRDNATTMTARSMSFHVT